MKGTVMRALVVCAERETSSKISELLYPEIKCDCTDSMRDAFAKARAVKYGLYFLDIGVGGVEACRAIRKYSNDPIIFISSEYNEAEAVAGFDAGADDYLSRPFGLLELSSRVRAILRRCEGHSDPIVEWIDIRTRTVIVDGKAVHLTPMEFDILVVLARARGQAVPKSVIIRDVWGVDSYATDDALKVRVNSLRSKIGSGRIETVRGFGYRLVPE